MDKIARARVTIVGMLGSILFSLESTKKAGADIGLNLTNIRTAFGDLSEDIRGLTEGSKFQAMIAATEAGLNATNKSLLKLVAQEILVGKGYKNIIKTFENLSALTNISAHRTSILAQSLEKNSEQQNTSVSRLTRALDALGEDLGRFSALGLGGMEEAIVSLTAQYPAQEKNIQKFIQILTLSNKEDLGRRSLLGIREHADRLRDSKSTIEKISIIKDAMQTAGENILSRVDGSFENFAFVVENVFGKDAARFVALSRAIESNTKETIKGVGRQQAVGETLSSLLNDIIDALQKLVGPITALVSEQIPKLREKIAELIPTFREWGKEMAVQLNNIFDTAKSTYTKIDKFFSKSFSDHFSDFIYSLFSTGVPIPNIRKTRGKVPEEMYYDMKNIFPDYEYRTENMIREWNKLLEKAEQHTHSSPQRLDRDVVPELQKMNETLEKLDQKLTPPIQSSRKK